MSQGDPEESEWTGTVLFTSGVLLMLLPIVAVVIGISKDEPDPSPIGGEQLFSSVEKLFASFAFGFVLLLSGTAELQKSPPRFSLRAMLIATTLLAVGLGLIVWAAK